METNQMFDHQRAELAKEKSGAVWLAMMDCGDYVNFSAIARDFYGRSANWELIDDNRDAELTAYWVECAKELGMLDSGYDFFPDLLNGTSFDKNMLLPCQLKPEDRYLVNTYDGTLVNEINSNFAMNPSCPLLLYYVYDDPWTIGKPEKVGPRTKLIMNPIGKHNSEINDPTLCPPEIKQEVMDYVQTYIY